MYEDEGVDFDIVLQAQQVNTRLQARHHELLDSDCSDKVSVADLEVNRGSQKVEIVISPKRKIAFWGSALTSP